ncbi:AraC family transcriptional regulator [Vibrio genomosp. F10]|uniref:AraC family transcriptional regulator n=1 Tax=Vibrio genomosp. F10 TaxID=723171 RepID=A0A1B9R1F2_9VIBR|nr:AraC family transcriptional regulator [Vibrio genomosp. F10]OCH78139.1 AraC family transcriptional regulator [Vibrio genomosp. F10]
MPTKELPTKENAQIQLANELGGLEFLHARYHRQNFSRHSHAGYTVGVIEDGAQQFYRTGGNHVAPQDSIILVNADELHSGQTATEGGWAYQAMYPTPEMFEQIAEGSDLGRKAPYFPNPVVYDPELAHLLRQVFEVLKHSNNRLYRETLLHGAMSQLVARHSLQRQAAPIQIKKTQAQIERIKAFLSDCPEENVSLSELASMVSLSPFHLARTFRAQVGLPPHGYQLQMRIRKAQKLLSMGLKSGTVAMDVGFHDQSHFHRHFKATVGVTPNQYRLAHQNRLAG